MRNYAILRLLLAGFLLYYAWPLIPGATTQLETIFWGTWLVFLLLTVGSNFATLLQMTSPPAMEQGKTQQRQNA